jgi:RNA polymerase sigma-70 factor (ECF subfamily)
MEDEGRAPHDEDSLITAAKTDPAAFAVLYQRYLPPIYRYLRVRLRSEEDAADLAQQVFLKALHALPGYQVPGPPFGAWLFRIARNSAIDASRLHRQVISWQHVPEDQQPADFANPEDMLLRQEVATDLYAALEHLSDEQRDLLIMRFAVGLTSKEIAAIVGKRESAIRKQISRGIQVLKERHDAR